MSAKKLAPTLDDYVAAAARLRCDVAAVRAVTEVEAPAGGFLPTGEPTILFERHVFHDLTDGRFDGARAPGLSGRYSLISSPEPSGPGEYGPTSDQHARMQAAVALDRTAALMSASWGMFQILGRYCHEAGYPALQGFVNAMYSGADAHLDAFVSLVIYRRLDDELRDHRWADFALRYNGRDYRRNRYDVNLADAWKKWSAAH